MGVVLEPLVVPVMEVCGFAVALGIIFVLHHFVRAVVGGIAGVVGRVPGIGRIISSPISAVYHWMDTEFGRAEQFLDAKMAAALHELARLCEWVGKEFHDHASLLLAVANVMTHPLSLHAYRALWTEEWKALAGLRKAITHADGGAIGAAIHVAIAPLNVRVSVLDKWIHARVRALQNTIAVTFPGEIRSLRERAKTIEDAAQSAYKRLSQVEAKFGTKAFAGLVVAALAYLGLDWLSCRNLRRRGTSLCNMDDALFEALLADTLLIVGSLSLVEFAREMVDITDTAIRPITSFWRAS